MKFIVALVVIYTVIQSSSAVNPWEPQERITDTENWIKVHKSLLKSSEDHKNDIKLVFLGDSITSHWMTEGIEVWNKYYANRGAFNYGIGGDTTQNVLWRIQNHELDGLNPKVIILLIGTNNIVNPGPTDADIAHGITQIIKELRAKLPNSKIISLGITPRSDSNGETKAIQINSLIAKNADEVNVFFLDMSSHFLDSASKEKVGLFKDGKHLTGEGYQVWYEAMEPTLSQLLK